MKNIIIGAVLVVGASAAVWMYGKAQYNAGRSECHSAHQAAALEKFQAEAERLTGLADLLHNKAQALADAKPKVIERYTRVEIEKPLPADCVFDDGRMRHVNNAIDEANAAGQLAPAVPADNAAKH